MYTSKTPLTVYKASAGSGKTFTLAIEYISLLINNPKSYENILAVTFTNKATEEMKMRILSQLYGISKGLPDSSEYLKMVKSKTGMEEKEVIRNAGTALSCLIHDYSHFRVQTIDAFFQRVLRNLTHELDLNASLRIDLNDKQVEEQAVEEMIESLETGDKVLDWIREYIDTNIREDHGWNVISEIKKFGNNIFRDFYKKNRNELNVLLKDENFFTEYVKKLRGKSERIKKDITGKAKEILAILDSHALNNYDYISYGNKGNVLSYINKVANGNFDGGDTPKRVFDCMEEPSKWAKKKTGKEKELTELANSFLNDRLRILEDTRKKDWKDYQSAILTLRHLNQLRLLHAIDETVEKINRNANRFQLSNTQTLLNTLISDSDSPFIFEKIGARLKHIMIDEFQDTSTVQWENFKVLLKDCISQRGSRNLIVGDVKQSIYRWRSGDWKLLNNINEEFREGQMTVMALDTNYRSEQKIVEFNNVFFEEAVKNTVEELKHDEISGYEQLSRAYDTEELRQIPNKRDGNGYIRIELLPNTNYRENVMQKLLDTVDEILGAGVEENDIAILVLANNNIREIADLFMAKRPDIRLVSDKAFRLDASMAVNILVNALRVLVYPDDILAKAELAKAYRCCILHEKDTESIMLVAEDIDKMLPKEFVDGFSELVAMPITDLVDRIYKIFGLSMLEDQSAYVCTFYDCLGDFLHDNPADVARFLNEWEETLHEKTIQSDESNGIRIISIHKSKGLEFDNVIIPLCDWQLEHRDIIIWCEKKNMALYDKLPVVPIDYSKNNMAGTVYESDYKKEHLQNTVDNMNLLYVAFTRAGKNLIITGRRMSAKKKDASATSTNRSKVIEECLGNVAERLGNCILKGLDDEKKELFFECGTLYAPRAVSKSIRPTPNVFTAPVKSHRINIETFHSHVEFRQSNKSREFVNGTNESPTLSYIKLGNILHELFSTIRTTDDIEPHLKELELEGIIYDDELSVEKVRSKLEKALSNRLVTEWFSGKWTLYNECTILTKDNSGNLVEYRPDRVMTDGNKTIVVDFKFGVPRAEYREQIGNYMRLISEMGHRSVCGYIWYVLRNEIVEVV